MMCDETTEQDLDAAGMFSRRDVGVLAGSVAVSMAIPAHAFRDFKVTEQEVIVQTPDGQADCYFVAPSTGKHPAIIVWPDVFGLRASMREIGKRLAGVGYAVLVVNPFYRSAKAPTSTQGATFDEAFRAKVGPMRALLTPDSTERDAKAFVAFLDGQKSVNRKKKIGTAGYCMGGPLVIRTAAALPDRVSAVAAFHPGVLASDKPDSPHLLIPKTKASYLIAIADNDDKANPDDKVKLRAAFDAAKRPAEVEVYTGAMHGWCPTDGRAYNQQQSARAFLRMLHLFGTTLGVRVPLR